jgi:hypothetical protein
MPSSFSSFQRRSRHQGNTPEMPIDIQLAFTLTGNPYPGSGIAPVAFFAGDAWPEMS